MNQFRLFPEQASTASHQTDALYIFLWSLTSFFTLLIFALIVYFAFKYRRTSSIAPQPVRTDMRLELLWTIIPLVISLFIFFWGAKVFFYVYHPPRDSLDVHVIGKQWMWKIQHPSGRREINELHVPVGQPVRLLLASQDVIHSFYVPAFRVKQDAVPGRYAVLWFQPDKIGEYHLFCAEYCGTQHSKMIGRVVVMDQQKYQDWLAGTPAEESPAVAGGKLFESLGCIKCHGEKAPTMAGLYGSRQRMIDGAIVEANEQYLRESILDSTARVVAGYAPIMPSFRGQITEEQLMEVIAYIKSLRDPATLRKSD
ncbi:MAG TPA: cytochrome c oxidase subunit II [Tepidisphaeraceae bacterium]|jgi:cytochrome c oxidase subunit 2|nr:cytochrome c oxidase subunit II [Tepidisphaeraceae bacterium]